MSKYIALQDKHISVGGRLIEAVAGQSYELSDEEIRRMPPGYFIPSTQASMASTELPGPTVASEVASTETEEPIFARKRKK